MAFAASGDARRAWDVVDMINPVNHSRTPAEVAVYKVEPYVMTADVYSVAPHTGRGGWSWYTGSAAWMHRAAIESIFGISQRNDELVVRPCLPSAWTQAELRLTRAGKSVRLLFVRATDATPESLAAAASARLLGVGEAVRWSSLDGAVPLLVVMADSSKSSQDAAAAELANAG
jgi:cyclic beta-1,2-glucan synthetase